MTEKELLKYKAVAEFEGCSSLEQAIELTDMPVSYTHLPIFLILSIKKGPPFFDLADLKFYPISSFCLLYTSRCV